MESARRGAAEGQKEEFLAIADGAFRVSLVPESFRPFAAEIRTALATSSNRKHLQAICDSAGIDLPSLADVLVTKEEAEASKPAPDLVIVAWEKLRLTPAECAMVGDTVYDAQACRERVVFWVSPGTDGLLEAGACGMADTGHLYPT